MSYNEIRSLLMIAKDAVLIKQANCELVAEPKLASAYVGLVDILNDLSDADDLDDQL